MPAAFASVIKPGMVVKMRKGVLKDGNGKQTGAGGYPLEIIKGKKLVQLYEYPAP